MKKKPYILILIASLLTTSSLSFANPVHLKCWSDNKVIFDKQVQDVVFEKKYVFAYTKEFSYAVYEADCLAVLPNHLVKKKLKH